MPAVPSQPFAGLVLACALAVGLETTAADPAAPGTLPAEARALTDRLGDPLPPGAVARLGTRRFCGPAAPMWVAFSPDGTKVASQDYKGVTVWDAATGRHLVERSDYWGVPGAIGWRPDGTGVAVVTLRDRSQFVSTFTDANERLPTPALAVGNVRGRRGPDGLDFVTLSPDAARLAVVRDPDADQFTIDLLPATPGRPVAGLKPQRTLGPFPGPCREVRYAAGGLVCLSGPWEDKADWSVTVIDPDKNAVVRTSRVPPPAYCVWRYMLSLSADARLAAVPTRAKFETNTHDGTIRVCDLVGGKELWSLPFDGDGYGTGHAFTPDGKFLITSGREPYFRVWGVATGKEVVRPAPGEGFYAREASAIAVSPDGKHFATGRRDGRVDLWDMATGKAVVPLATHRDTADGVAVSPDGRLAATFGWDGCVRVWELATGKPGCVIPAPLGQEPQQRFWSRRRPVFSPDGRGLLFTAAGELAMADPVSGRALDLPAGLRGRRGVVGGFAAGGKVLATFAGDAVTLWDWPAGTARVTVTVPLDTAKLPGPADDRPEVVTVNSATLSPDGRLLFTSSTRWKGDPKKGGHSNTKDVWDARTGKRLRRLDDPPTGYPPAVFDPGSGVMYLGGSGSETDDGKRTRADALTAWDPAAGKLLRRFADPKPGAGDLGNSPQEVAIRRHMRFRTVDALALSPEGRLLAATEGPFSGDFDVWLFETLSGRPLMKFAGHSSRVKDLAFGPDGRRLVSVSDDQTGLVWDVSLQALGAVGGKPTDKALAEAWDRLANLDPVPAYAGVAALAAAPAEGIAILRAKLRPAPVPTDADLDRIVAGLNAEDFAARQKASAELDRFGPNAVAGAKTRLEQAPSPEVRERLTKFLARHGGPDPSPHHLRSARAVAALEAMSTPEARAFLADLAGGPADDPLTGEARAAARRDR